MSSENTTDEEQARFLEDATKIVKEQAFYMKRAMDSDNLKLSLDHATEMLRELRTNLLTPKNYYELYMKVVDEMRELEEFFNSLQRGGKSMVQIYEQVQSCGNVVPRLYLLCCVGGVYISSLEAPAKDILKDMVEMIKGVQHPMRGLFLRNYLTQISKNKLPDIGSPYEGTGGNVQDAYNFLLQNFAETNRLWTRLQTQGASKDKKKREKERQELRILVGTNLVRLSQLEGLDIQEYKENVLPKIIEEIIGCKDTIAQSYLMDCLIQVFPDEFHFATLSPFLECCSQLKERVNVRTILESLMDRLAKHVSIPGNHIPADVNAFKLFNDCVTSLIEGRTNMSLSETLRLQTVLSNFALKCYPQKMEYVAHCLATCGILIDKTEFANQIKDENNEEKAILDATAQIELLLSTPLSSLGLRVLEIPAYSKLMSYLPWSNWKEVAAVLLRSVLAINTPLTDTKQVEELFGAITPLLRDREGFVQPTDEDGRDIPDNVIFKEEQHLVSRITHLLRNDDTDGLLLLYGVARKHFTNGGSHRINYTCAPLVFGALSLARRVYARERAAESETESVPKYPTKKVFQFVLEIITGLQASHPEQAMQLFLQAAQAADECGFDTIAYAFIQDALTTYENDITDSKVQVRTLTSVIGTLLNCKNFTSEDYETFITGVTQYSSKLLKKADQCRMITLCSHLFWPKSADGVERYSDSDNLMKCLQKSLKIASICNPNLFIEILDRYTYYFENDNPKLEARFISGLMRLIEQDGQLDASVQAHYRNTVEYIKTRQQSAEHGQKFIQIEI